MLLKNGKWLPDFIERLKASAWHQLYLPLLPFTHTRSESINADSLKLQLLTARKKEWWPATAYIQFTPGGLPDNCETHCVSGNRTHDLPIVSPTRYQLCHRHHHSCVRLSVCRLSVTYLFMAKRCGLPNNCPNKQIGNGLWQIEWSCDR